MQLTSGCLFRGLASIHETSWEGPLSAERVASPLDKQNRQLPPRCLSCGAQHNSIRRQRRTGMVIAIRCTPIVHPLFLPGSFIALLGSLPSRRDLTCTVLLTKIIGFLIPVHRLKPFCDLGKERSDRDERQCGQKARKNH